MKTICIYHSIDLDGWMSAAIVKKWFQENNSKNAVIPYEDKHLIDEIEDKHYLYMLGWNYGDEIPDLSDYDRIIMCDISFPAEKMWNIQKQVGYDNFVWIDHHISAINNTNNYYKEHTLGHIGGLQRTNFAACELTWRYFFGDNMPEIVYLLGRYDCFGHKGTDKEQKVLEFQYGARQCINSYETAYNYLSTSIHNYTAKVSVPIESIIHEKGKAIYQYLCTEAQWIYKMGKEVELVEMDGQITNVRKFIAINRSRFNPVNFGINYHDDGYDGVLCYNYNKDKWTASLYNDNGEVDCSAIAKTLGGGGHKGAAGFVMENTDIFRKLLDI